MSTIQRVEGHYLLTAAGDGRTDGAPGHRASPPKTREALVDEQMDSVAKVHRKRLNAIESEIPDPGVDGRSFRRLHSIA